MTVAGGAAGQPPNLNTAHGDRPPTRRPWGIDKMLISALMARFALMGYSSPTGGPSELIFGFSRRINDALSPGHLLFPLSLTVFEKISKNLLFL